MGVSNPSYFITTKNKKNMENAIIVPFDLETAKKINIGERVGQIVTEKGRNRAEIVYEDDYMIRLSKTKLEKKNMKLNNIRMFYNIASIK
jgi:hypothetical protein